MMGMLQVLVSRIYWVDFYLGRPIFGSGNDRV